MHYKQRTLQYFGVGTILGVVGIAPGYGLDDRGVGVRVPCLHVVQTVSGTHSASYRMGNGGSFPGGKATGA
jgi:hypothetical protein